MVRYFLKTIKSVCKSSSDFTINTTVCGVRLPVLQLPSVWFCFRSKEKIVIFSTREMKILNSLFFPVPDCCGKYRKDLLKEVNALLLVLIKSKTWRWKTDWQPISEYFRQGMYKRSCLHSSIKLELLWESSFIMMCDAQISYLNSSALEFSALSTRAIN